MKRASALVLAAALIAGGAALVFVAARGPAPPSTMQDRVDAVASTLRCPVCLDLSVADSPSLVARQMRATIKRRLRAGQSADEIRSYFESRFGESIRLSPEPNGLNLLAWILPGLLFAAGLFLVVAAIRRWSARPPPLEPAASVSEADRAMLERELGELDVER